MELEYKIEDWITVAEDPKSSYGRNLIYPDECYNIISACFEVHNTLGRGFSEVVYKDALELELQNRSMHYERERKYEILYKSVKLAHYYYADFVVLDKIILEVKASSDLIDKHLQQTLNYLAVSKCKLGVIVNFGEDRLRYKRIVL